MSKNRLFAAFIGNIFDHYDNALFGLLAPFISNLFFEKSDPLTALILTYGMIPLGFIARPLGSIFFGWIGDRYGRKEALFFSLLGMAIVTTTIGFLPTYKEIGLLAPLALALGKMLQNFCAAGESTGGAIFILENTSEPKHNLMSSWYDSSSILGILIASSLVTFLSAHNYIEQYWRILFWIGALTAIFGILVRWNSLNHSELVAPSKIKKSQSLNWINIIIQNKSSLISIIVVSGFSYAIYSFAFTFMNGFIPIITHLSKFTLMKTNTFLLIIDLFLLPFFGLIATKFGKERLMLAALLCSCISAIPLFAVLKEATIEIVTIVRLLIILFGVAFSASYYAWAIEQITSTHRYLILSLGSSIGSQLIGGPCCSICLWLFKITGFYWVPGLYLTILSAIVLTVIHRSLILPIAKARR